MVSEGNKLTFNIQMQFLFMRKIVHKVNIGMTHFQNYLTKWYK